jgi:hypothetical protein
MPRPTIVDEVCIRHIHTADQNVLSIRLLLNAQHLRPDFEPILLSLKAKLQYGQWLMVDPVTLIFIEPIAASTEF